MIKCFTHEIKSDLGTRYAIPFFTTLSSFHTTAPFFTSATLSFGFLQVISEERSWWLCLFDRFLFFYWLAVSKVFLARNRHFNRMGLDKQKAAYFQWKFTYGHFLQKCLTLGDYFRFVFPLRILMDLILESKWKHQWKIS